MTVRDLVWQWLDFQDRRTFLYNEVTKGLCGPHRKIARLTATPRQAIRDALEQLADEGLVTLHAVAGRGVGRPGLRIEVISSTQEERNL